MSTTTTLPQRLAEAFGEGIATAYLHAYDAATVRNDIFMRQALLAAVNAKLKRMATDGTTAYEDAKRILPEVHKAAARLLFMAATVIVALGNLRPGTVITELPDRQLLLG